MAHPPPGRAPALAAASAFALGVAVGSRLGLDPVPLARTGALAGLAVLLPAAVNLVYARPRSMGAGRPRRFTPVPWADAALLAGLVLSGISLYTVRHRTVAEDDVALFPLRERLLLEGTVEEVRTSAGGRSSIVARIRSVRAPPGRGRGSEGGGTDGTRGSPPDAAPPASEDRLSRGRVWAGWPDDSSRPCRGDDVVLEGELSVPRGRRNPGAFDFAAYLRHRGIHRVLRRCEPTVTGRRRGPGTAAAWVARTIRHRLPGRAADVMLALLLGRSRELPDELVAAFRRSGTVHVLAVSGLHVGFVVLIVHALLRCARIPPRLARVLVLPFLAAFAVLIGPRPSVLRACTMASLFLVASVAERRTNPLNLLGVAGLSLLAARPGVLFDLGFQLSFSAVAGILVLFEPLHERTARVSHLLGGWARRPADALALSLAAQLGVAPVLVASFGELSIAACVANIIAVPLAAVSVASGVATLLTAAAGAWPSTIFAACSWLSATTLASVARFTGSWAWASVPVASRLWPAVMAGSVSAAVLLRGRSPAWRRAGSALAVLAIACALLLTTTGPGRSYARLVFFDVGQGDAALVELPGRHYLLVDAGPGPRLPGQTWSAPGRGPDAGRRVVVPYLRRQGIRKLDALLVTHAHADHFGGAAAVLRDIGSKALLLPPGGSRDPELAELVEAARTTGCVVREVSRGDTIAIGETALAVLAPETRWRAGGLSHNDGSIVLALRLCDTGVLFTGDIEAKAEALLCSGAGDAGTRAARSDALEAYVLKVPHHGAATSSGRPFLSRVGPRLAIVSVGEDNRYGHPHPDALARLRQSGARVLRTDVEGAVLLVPKGGAAHVSTVARGRVIRP